MTFLFNEIVFGPVSSRRLGVSLGINLLPVDCKYCNFDCLYCECGRNGQGSNIRVSGSEFRIPNRQEVYAALEYKLSAMQQTGQLPDSITFSGNGEPTIHPAFPGIIDDKVSLRERYAPNSKISVLTNATMLHRQDVVDALRKTDMPMLKFDSAFDATIHLLNQPVKKMTASGLIKQLQAFGNQCIVQTMFLQGTYHGQVVDNTTPAELDAWERAILTIRPAQVMIYTIVRNTPTDTLCKVSVEKLREIAVRIEKQGIPVQVSG